MALTKNQNNLLIELRGSIKSFDATFNSLLHKKFVDYYKANDKNEFCITDKGEKKADKLCKLI